MSSLPLLNSNPNAFSPCPPNICHIDAWKDSRQKPNPYFSFLELYPLGNLITLAVVEHLVTHMVFMTIILISYILVFVHLFNLSLEPTCYSYTQNLED